MKVIFDLDGTLALVDHRRHHVSNGNSDWDAFNNACVYDEPNVPVIETLLRLDLSGAEIEIWSGRSDEVIDKTRAWLSTVALSKFPLKMRPQDNKMSDVELKQSWLDQTDRRPMLTYDDRDSVVAMWRRNGIVCCQVAPGDF